MKPTPARTAAAALAALLGTALGTAGAPPSSAQPVAQATVVSANPQDSTPRLPIGSTGQYVARAYAQIGSTVFVGGTFPSVNSSARSNVAAFDARTGAPTPFAPVLNGVVKQLLPSPDGQLYLAGTFTTVNGVARRGVAKVSTTGVLNTAFDAGLTAGSGTDLQLVRGRLLVSGSFPARLIAVDPATGRNTGYLAVPITGALDSRAGSPRVERFEVSPAGDRLVAIGNFTAVSGQGRRQAFMLSLGTTSATLSPWWSTRFAETCAPPFPFYLRDVDFSPDGSRFALVSTGAAFPQTVAANRRKLCDSTSLWSSTSTSAASEPLWVNYTGGDSLYAVRLTQAAVYVGGHMRWLNNPNGSNSDGGCVGTVCPLAVAGLGAIDPATGRALSWNPRRDARGSGVEVFLVTPSGLWVGGDAAGQGRSGCSTPLPGGDCTGRPLELHPGIVFFPL